MTAVVSLTAGTMFLMWLGEQITERGLGNGISILILQVLPPAPSSIGGLLELVSTGAMSAPAAIFIVLVVGLVTYFVVFVERGQRKILVNYARRQVGATRFTGGQVVASAPEVEHGWRDSTDLCIVDHPAAGLQRGELVQCRRFDALAEGYLWCSDPVSRSM